MGRLIHCLLPAALLCMITCLSSNLRAQNYLYGTGNQSWGINLPIENGYINVANGEVHFELTLANLPQRGSLSLDEQLVYDSRIWQIIDNGSSYGFQPTNVPNSMAGWRFIAGNEVGSIQVIPQVYDIDCYGGNPSGNQPAYYQYWFNWTDPSGALHQFPIQTQEPISGFCAGSSVNYNLPNQPTASGYAVDGSGYYMNVTNYTSAVVFDSNGNQVYPTVVDRNGNYFSNDSNGNLVDTLGRTPLLKSTSGNQTFYDALTIGGATKRYTITTETIDVNTAFGQSGVNDYSGTLTAIQSIALPDGSTYTFNYDSGSSSGNYGEITSITLPTGGTVSLGYENYLDSYQNENRWLGTYLGGRGQYSFSPQVVAQCTGPTEVGCQERMTVWDGEENYVQYLLTLNNGAWNSQVDFYNAPGSHILSTATSYNFATSCQAYDCNGAQWITASKVATTLSDTGQLAETQYAYASPWLAKPSSVKMWDYSAPVGGTPTKETDYTYGYYVNGAAFATQTTQLDSSGNSATEIVYNYDQGTPSPTSGLPNHSSVSGARGNLTSAVAGVGTTVNTSSTYDDAGMKLTDINGNGNQKSYTNMCSDAYRQRVTYAPVVNGQHLQTTKTYDCFSGLVTATQDMNGVVNSQSTINSYFPSGSEIGRLHTVTYPDGGTTTYSYPSFTETDKTVTQTSSVNKTTKSILDSFGRPYQSVTVAPEGSISSETSYDNDGRPYSVTNPHLQGTASSTDGTTLYYYDVLGRLYQTQEPDGHYLEATYNGPTETDKDELGHSKQYTYDAFHRLITVMEPNASGALAYETDYQYNALDKLSQVDQWGGAHGATSPGDRRRVFSYDTLGRLLSATTPETGNTGYPGTINYTYDSNGNLKTKTDARRVVATYGYDALNRLTSMSYSSDPSTTPSSCLQYDTSPVNGAGLNSIGRLTNEWTQSASGACAAALPTSGGYLTLKAILAYDPMGRPKSVQQCTPSNCTSTTPYSLAYGYDLAGNMTSYTNGLSSTPGAGTTPLTLTNAFDEADRLQSVTSTWNDALHPPSLFGAQSVSPFAYAPPGGLAYATYGNGLTLSRTYDNRLRISGETDTGGLVVSPTAGSATIAITGSEQSH